MRNCIIVLVTATLLTTAVLSQETRPTSKPASSTSASGPKVTLQAQFKPGDSWLLAMEMNSESVYGGGNAGGGGPNNQRMTSQMTMDFRLDVLKGDNGPAIEMAFLRARQKHHFGDQPEKSMDTDNLPANTEGSNDVAVFSALKLAKLKFTVDEKGKISYVEGLASVVEAIKQNARGNPPPPEMEKAISLIFESALRDCLGTLPSKPVAVGESWEVDKDQDRAMMSMPMKLDAKCTLKEIQDTPEGKTATIETSGTTEPNPGAAGRPMPAQLPKYKLEGTSVLSLSKGIFIRSEMRAEPETLPPGTSSKTITKITLKPATAPASAPATTQAATKAVP